MIYILLGTKGQFMKMFPVLKAFDKHKISYVFIHTSQHFKIIEENIKRFDIREPDIYLTQKKNDLKNPKDFIFWAPKVLFNARNLKIKSSDYLILHGDTESTLLGLLIGMYFRAKIVHIEAGLRSGNFLDPFPEEIIRNIVSRFSNICFSPTQEDAKNIKGKKEIHITNGNTIFDSVAYALRKNPSEDVNKMLKNKYVLFLTHRKETLFSETRVKSVLSILEKVLKKKYKVYWVLHANTIYEIKARHLWSKVLYLQSKYKLELFDDFFNYVDFMHLVKNSEFVVSDGGGLQEETYILNKPILILRKRTERRWGLGETAFLSNLDNKRVDYFMNNFTKFRRTEKNFGSPSELIANYFKPLSKNVAKES